MSPRVLKAVERSAIEATNSNGAGNLVPVKELAVDMGSEVPFGSAANRVENQWLCALETLDINSEEALKAFIVTSEIKFAAEQYRQNKNPKKGNFYSTAYEACQIFSTIFSNTSDNYSYGQIIFKLAYLERFTRSHKKDYVDEAVILGVILDKAIRWAVISEKRQSSEFLKGQSLLELHKSIFFTRDRDKAIKQLSREAEIRHTLSCLTDKELCAIRSSTTANLSEHIILNAMPSRVKKLDKSYQHGYEALVKSIEALERYAKTELLPPAENTPSSRNLIVNYCSAMRQDMQRLIYYTTSEVSDKKELTKKMQALVQSVQDMSNTTSTQLPQEKNHTLSTLVKNVALLAVTLITGVVPVVVARFIYTYQKEHKPYFWFKPNTVSRHQETVKENAESLFSLAKS